MWSRRSTGPDEQRYPHAVNVGPIGRLGRYTATHFRLVLDRLADRRGRSGFLRPAGRDRAVRRGLGDDRARSRCRRGS